MTLPSVTSAVSPTAQARRRVQQVGLAWLVMAAWPWIAGNDYILSLGVLFFINLLLIAGLNLVMGYGGQISLCQAGWFGLGAYTSGVLAVKWGLMPWVGLVAAPISAALAALVIGLPALRLRGNYLAMATLGFNAILSVLFVELVSVTGGPNGLAGIPPIVLAGYTLDTPGRFFWLAWLVGGVAMVLLASLLASRAGRALRAVAGSEVAASSMGGRSAAHQAGGVRAVGGVRRCGRRAVRPTSTSTHHLTPSASLIRSCSSSWWRWAAGGATSARCSALRSSPPFPNCCATSRMPNCWLSASG